MLKSVTQWLDQTAERFPDKIAFGTEIKGETIVLTFSELRTAARKIGAYLAATGHFKEPVMIAMDKTPQYVAAMLGCAYANCPYAPVDIDNPPERIAKIVEKMHPCACITSSERIMSKLGDVPNILLYDDLVADTQVNDANELLGGIQKCRISTVFT